MDPAEILHRVADQLEALHSPVVRIVVAGLLYYGLFCAVRVIFRSHR
jgi:hypothetical protein